MIGSRFNGLFGVMLATMLAFATSPMAAWVELNPYGESGDPEESTPDFEWEDVYFTNASTGWIVGWRDSGQASQSSAVYRTGNGGLTWTRQPVPLQTRLLGVFFLDSLRGWVVGEAGSARTTDGGVTWVAMGAQDGGHFEGRSGRAVHFIDAQRGWIAGDEGTGARTTDGGATWTHVASNHGGTFIRFTDPDTGWRFTSASQLFRSTDGGLTWTPRPLPDPVGPFAPSPRAGAFLNGAAAWMPGPGAGQIQRTTDGGATWTTVATGASRHFSAVRFAGQHGIAVGERVTARTTDGGATWTVADTLVELATISVSAAEVAYAIFGTRVYRWSGEPSSLRPVPAKFPHRIGIEGRTLRFTLARGARVEMTLRDGRGRVAARLQQGRLDAGVHTAVIPARLPPGNYLLEMRVDGDRRGLRVVLD